MASAGSIYVELLLDDESYKKKLSETLISTQTTAQGIEASWRALGSKSGEWFDAQRKAAENAYILISNSANTSAAEIIRAEEAKNSKISELNSKQFGETKGFLEGIVGSWVEGAAAMVTGWLTIQGAMSLVSQGMDTIRAGAKALQSEEAFKNVAESVHVNAEQWVADLKRVTNETIDDSALMQQAMKMASRGMDPEQITQIFEIARTAARRLGVDVGEAATSIGDAIENMRSRALVQYGLLSKEEAAWISRIKTAGEEYDILPLIMANVAVQADLMGKAETNAAEVLQQHTARVHEFKEAIGKGLIDAIGTVIGWLDQLGDSWRKNSAPTFDMSAYEKAALGIKELSDTFEEGTFSVKVSKEDQLAWDERQKAMEEARLQAKAFEAAAIEAANKATEWNNKMVDMWTAADEKLAVAKGGADTLQAALDKLDIKYLALAEDQRKVAEETGHTFDEGILAAIKAKEVTAAVWDDWNKRMKEWADQTNKFYEDQAKAATDYSSIISGLYLQQADIHNQAMGKIDSQEAALLKKLGQMHAEGINGIFITDQQYFDAIDLLNQVSAEKQAKIAQDLAEKRTAFAATSYANIKGMEDTWLAASMAAIKAKADKEIAAGMDVDAVTAASYAARTKLLIEYGQKSDSVAAGAQAAWLELYNKQMTMGQAAHDSIIGLYSDMTKTLEDVFFDAFTGNLKTAADYWNAFCNDLYKMFAAMLAKLVVAWAASGIAELFGIGGGGGGAAAAAGSALGISSGGGGVTNVLSSLVGIWGKASGASKVVGGPTIPGPADAVKSIYGWLTGSNTLTEASIPMELTPDIMGLPDIGSSLNALQGTIPVITDAFDEAAGTFDLAAGGIAEGFGVLDAGIGGLCTTADGAIASFEAADIAAEGLAGGLMGLGSVIPVVGAVFAAAGIADIITGGAISGALGIGGGESRAEKMESYREQAIAAAQIEAAHEAAVQTVAEGIASNPNYISEIIAAAGDQLPQVLLDAGEFVGPSQQGPVTYYDEYGNVLTAGPEPIYLGEYHSGGVIGDILSTVRSIPASSFAGAPRLHKGLAADEYPAILQSGETVLPRGARGKSSYTFNLYATVTDQRTFEDFAEKIHHRITKLQAWGH